MDQIKAVFLDVDDTLLDFHICAKEAIRAAFAEWGLPYTDSIFPVFLEINDSLWEALEKKQITREELYVMRWSSIFNALSIDSDGIAFDTCFRRYAAEIAVPCDGAADLLSYLAPRYVLCITSNSTQKRQETRLENAGMLPYIRHIFTSEKIGHVKPDKAFFDACLSQLDGISPQEVVVIGDSLSADIAGGIGCGMHTIWYNPAHAPLPKSLCPDAVVHTLYEIQRLLRKSP